MTERPDEYDEASGMVVITTERPEALPYKSGHPIYESKFE